MPEIDLKDNIRLLLDKHEFEVAREFKWVIRKGRFGTYYISTQIYYHRYSFAKLVFGLNKDQMIYHMNGNPFDFRKSEILIVSRQEYSHMRKGSNVKSSQYRRVFFDNDNQKWGVLVIKGKGYFWWALQLRDRCCHCS